MIRLVPIVSLLVLVACGGARGATTEPQTVAQEPAAVPVPAAQQRTSAAVVAAFKAVGLEAEQPRPMTKDDYGAAPMLATEGTRFLIPSLGNDAGGRVFVFASQAALEKTKAYYDELGKESAMFFSWTFADDLTLVQINGDLPEEKARQYEVALKAME